MINKKNLNKKLDDVFYKKSLRPDSQNSFKRIAQVVSDEFNPSSVVDLGCGAAWILYYLHKDHDIRAIQGLEPNDYIKSFVKERVKYSIVKKSLIDDLSSDRRFDLCMCLEVAEHIDEKYSDIVVKNICLFSNTVLFSAATPGQGGYGHVNEQMFEYWKKKFELNGFVHCGEQSKRIRNWLGKKRVQKWYKNNMNVFVKH